MKRGQSERCLPSVSAMSDDVGRRAAGISDNRSNVPLMDSYVAL